MRIRPVEVHGHPPTIDDECVREQQGDRARQQPVLHRADPVVEPRHVVVGEDRDRLLQDDRAAVERRIDEVDRASGDRDAM